MSHPHDDPLQPHAHDPNPSPPSEDPGFIFTYPDGAQVRLTVADLEALPETTLTDCYIVSTGHGTSGPFIFGGASLLALVQSHLPSNTAWSQVEVISADGFGTRVKAEELLNPDPGELFLLSYRIDGRPMTRQQGLVRLIVPTEKEDALRQVKWVGQIRVRR